MNKENIAINKDGIRVKSANETIYFLLAIEPLTLILFLIEFLISIKIKIKNNSTKTTFEIRRISRLPSLSLIKLLLIKVKNVRKANKIVNINITMINKFLFNRANII
tara:strand:+ start:88 stop:408 length:321 start_codon:yes stop_codon:yes gene_type:complete